MNPHIDQANTVNPHVWILALAEPESRQSAARALIQAQALKELLAGTHHPNPAVRHGCFWVLDRLKGPGIHGVFPALIEGLSDTHPKLRHYVASLLKQRLRRMPAEQLRRLRHLSWPGFRDLVEEVLETKSLLTGQPRR